MERSAALAPEAQPAPRWQPLPRRRRRSLDWCIEQAIFAVAAGTLLLALLILLFVGREALPVVLGRLDSSRQPRVYSPAELETLRPDQLRAYLDLTPAQLAQMDPSTLRELMAIQAETARNSPTDKDAALNTTRWRYLLLPYQWSDYDQPEFIWQPISSIHKYNIVPLLIGTFKTTIIALLVAVPLALAAALYVSQMAPPAWRLWIKSSIELIAGIPSVVLGMLALVVLASTLQSVFGYPSRLNAFVAGLALAVAVIPVTFSVAEEAMSHVPSTYTQAAMALGASAWQAAWHVVVPAALPGIVAAVFLGFGRALGETMIVLMASGNASIVSANPLDSTRTITATIAAEISEAVVGGHHYRMLFFIGALLLLIAFATQSATQWTLLRLQRKWEGLPQ